MGFSRGQRNLRLFFSIIAFVVLLIVTLGIIIALNYLQRKIKEKQKNFWNYVISLLISIILAVVTAVGKIIFKKLTFMEKIEIKTSYYISFSIKLTLFTFCTIAVLPVVSNFIFGFDGNDILVNNLLMIFITDIFKRGSYVIYNTKAEELIMNAFNLKEIYEGIFIPSIMSRKKQMLPPIMEILEMQ